jgi:hypothetical protein
MDLLALAQWFEESGVGRTIRESVWAFAVIESIHLMALVMLGGAALLVDMRLLNLGLRQRPVAELARDAQRFFSFGLGLLVISGSALFASEAVKCYYSAPFRLKIFTLFFATIFTYAVRNRVALADEGRVGGAARALVAVMSIGMWFTVAAAGRWIGFSG